MSFNKHFHVSTLSRVKRDFVYINVPDPEMLVLGVSFACSVGLALRAEI